MPRTLALHVHTPEEEMVLPGVVRLRFETWDGHRGVLPGHEPALALCLEGPIHVVSVDGGDERERYIAAEEGLVRILPDAVHLITRWATEAPTIDLLLRLVERRTAFRRRVEDEARALGKRHEVALQRALIRLKREPYA